MPSSSPATTGGRTRSTTSSRLVDDWIELHGDRAGTDDHAIVAGVGSFRGRTIAIVGHQKGRDLKERAFRNFGMAQPQGYAKARRVFALADRLGFPVVTMIDTPGAYPGVEAEQARPGRRDRPVDARDDAPARADRGACVIGEGGSGGALAIGVADRVLMLEHSIYSVISPEGCAAILWRDVNQRRKAAAAFKPTARFSYELGVVDTVVPEPSGGAHKDFDRAARLLGRRDRRRRSSRSRPSRVEQRRAARRAKFRRMGVWLEDGVVVGEKEHDPAARPSWPSRASRP